MCELIVIAAVFAIAIEIKCGELFYARKINTRITEKLQSNDGHIYRRVDIDNLGGDKSLPILCRRECSCEASEKDHNDCD